MPVLQKQSLVDILSCPDQQALHNKQGLAHFPEARRQGQRAKENRIGSAGSLGMGFAFSLNNDLCKKGSIIPF